MFGYVKELDMEITCFTIAGIWYDRVYRKGKETQWMKRDRKSLRRERLNKKERKNARKMS